MSGNGLWVLGVGLACAGNVMIACSLSLQKYVHNKQAAAGKPASRSPLFWLALAGMIGGEVGNFAAFVEAGSDAVQH